MKPAIVETMMSEFVTEGRQLLANVVTSEREAAWQRVILGRFLCKIRGRLPKRGTPTHGWGAFIEALELDQATADRYMKLAEASLSLTERDKDKVPTYASLGLDRREGVVNDEAPHAAAGEAPPEGVDVDVTDLGETATAPPKANRDAWCTPGPIARALPKRLDLDPCSNPHSIVKAKTKYMLEAGQNGLELPWFGLVFVNGPYSDLLPFAEKLEAERNAIIGAAFLVNSDNSPAWWHALTKHLELRLDFDARQEFIPPPGVEPSKNDRPQTLLMDQAFWAACDQRALLQMGTLWQQLKA